MDDQRIKELERVADLLSHAVIEDDPNDQGDKEVHMDILEFYRDRISECLEMDMKDVALAYHAQINKDKRLTPKERTVVLLDTLKLFKGEEQ